MKNSLTIPERKREIRSMKREQAQIVGINCQIEQLKGDMENEKRMVEVKKRQVIETEIEE